MLVLTRKVGKQLVFGNRNEIVLTVVRISGGRVRLGIEADASTPVRRVEQKKVIPAEWKSQVRESCHVVGIAH